MSDAVAVMARFTSRPDARPALRDLLQGMLTPTRSEPGCLSYELHEAPEGGDFVLFELYSDADALSAHRLSTHYANYRSRVEALLTGPIAVSLL